ncbi:MAG: hypothetical protein FWH24_03235, partial [Oscillospiraceae bacterium]|nr:hypothetical protein [Oscillospiraceae bacterium]
TRSYIIQYSTLIVKEYFLRACLVKRRFFMPCVVKGSHGIFCFAEIWELCGNFTRFSITLKPWFKVSIIF